MIWPRLPPYAIEQIEAEQCQVSRLTSNWFDATVDEVQCFPKYQIVGTKAKRFRQHARSLPRLHHRKNDAIVSSHALPG